MTKKNQNSKLKVPSGLSVEVGTMIEHFDGKLGFMAEQLGHVTKVADQHTEILNYQTETLEIIKMDIEFIKSGLKKKVDVDDFQALEHRVALLESRR